VFVTGVTADPDAAWVAAHHARNALTAMATTGWAFGCC
jgi:hypothetical protein